MSPRRPNQYGASCLGGFGMPQPTHAPGHCPGEELRSPGLVSRKSVDLTGWGPGASPDQSVWRPWERNRKSSW